MYVDQECIFYYLTVINEPLPDAGDARRRGVREGILKGLYRFKASAEERCQAARATVRQRRDHVRGAQGAGDPGRKVRRRRRRLERHQLQGAVPRCATIASAGTCCIPATTPRVPYVTQTLKDAPGVVRRGIGLHEGAAGNHRAMDAAAAGIAWHRRLRPQRGPRRACAISSRSMPSTSCCATLTCARAAKTKMSNDRNRANKAVKRSGHQSRKKRIRPSAEKGSARRAVTEFKLPELGENIDQGDLVRLMIAPGADVNEGQPVMELETDKAVVEVPSSVSGHERNSRQGRRQAQSRPGHLHRRERRRREGARRSARASRSRPRARTSASGAEARPSRAARASRAPALDPKKSAAPPPQPRASAPPRPRTPGATEFKIARTRRKHRSGRSGPPDDLARHEGLRRPARDGTGNRQGRGRSSLFGQRHRERNSRQRRRQDQSRPGDLHARRRLAAPAPERRTSEPVEHVSGQQAARLAFQLAMQAEGKTEEQALPPDQPSQAPPAFSMPVATRQSGRHRASRSGTGGAACAASGARTRPRYPQRRRNRPRRTHQRRRREGLSRRRPSLQP